MFFLKPGNCLSDLGTVKAAAITEVVDGA
jgi:hypothetical protein